MKTLNEWIQLYARDHQNPTNQKIHTLCVPAIMWSLLGLLWALPRPELFRLSPWANWATLFCALCLLFYASLGWRVALSMLGVSLIMLSSLFLIAPLLPLWQTSLAVFVIAWIGQFIGHKIEGQKPSFFEDLQFLLIGPVWVLVKLKLLPH